jgi:hypothetical protein
MIGLDIWFTQFGVRMQKLCKSEVPDLCRAEVAGRPALHLWQAHHTFPQDHLMDPYEQEEKESIKDTT